MPNSFGCIQFQDCNRYIQNCPDKTLAKRCDSAFVTKGYSNWKKAPEKFKAHEYSRLSLTDHTRLQAKLKAWLKRKHDWCSPEIQNEMVQLPANELVRRLVSANPAQNPVVYFVICDKTRDVAGRNRYVSV
ncbi:hypothetical protein PR048_009063 [Dryococelus australis]|uniref:Uncharacterized protein n=1 Tax=Dryococelus australis TaxID=614101 RepID=A0ABQ9HYW4_9NEOP|nr:hypothetical protein PR048_009063 [Dryococelus australis]